MRNLANDRKYMSKTCQRCLKRRALRHHGSRLRFQSALDASLCLQCHRSLIDSLRQVMPEIEPSPTDLAFVEPVAA